MHFEAMVFNPSTQFPSTARNGCGYYVSQQSITDNGYIDPTGFIADHVQSGSISGFTYVDSWICEKVKAGLTTGDLDPDNIRSVFGENEHVCCLTELTNVAINHRFKVEAYCNGQKMWEFADNWRTVNGTWNYSHFYPFWNGVPAGNDEFRVYIDVDKTNSDDVDDWRSIATKHFTVESDGIVRIAGMDLAKPGNLAVNSVTQNSVTLSWDQGLNTASNLAYHVYRSTSQSASSAYEIASTNNNSYNDGNLSPTTKYYYWVKAAVGSELSDYSDCASVTTQGLPGDGSIPTPPSDLNCVFVSSDQVKVRWSVGTNNPNNIANYKLFVGTASNSDQAVYTAITPYTEQAVYNLNPALTYYFWSKAVNHNGSESGFSTMTSVTMANYVYPPANLTAVNSNGSVSLAWTCQNANASYRVYRGLASDLSDQSLVISPGSPSFVDVGGQPGTTYYYRVSAVLNNSVSDYSNIASATTTTFMAPDSFRIVEVKPDKVRLAWKKSLGTIYNYWLYRFLNGGQQWVNSANDTFYVDSTVEVGKTYSYKVRAHSDVNSSISAPVFASIPFKKNVYSDFVMLPDLDSNGYAEAAYLYKKGDDSVLVSISDLGNNRILKMFSLGNYIPNSLAGSAGSPKLMVALNNSSGDTTFIRVVDIGLNKQTFVLNQPSNFQASTASYDRVNLSWQGNNPDSVAAFYCIYASPINDSLTAQFIGSTSGTNYAQAGLSPGGNWYYWLRSAVGAEVSPLVGPLAATTNPLLAPVNLAARQVTDSRVVLGWNTVAGVNGYRVYRDGSYLAYVAADSLVDIQVNQQSQYAYQVVSVFGNYYSSPTDALSVFTPWLQAISSIKGFEDMDFLPDLDNDGQPELALLATDSLTNRPVVYIKSGDGMRVVTTIAFFSSGTMPNSFMPIIDLNNDGLPEFTMLGNKGDTAKIETRYYSGDTLIR
ncbi:MAG: fibronectin type III domain-containing protein [Patescibacteria group bacterium]|nr:fibronectin type III domain-containing protein [Patescibacteria group bacterium]